MSSIGARPHFLLLPAIIFILILLTFSNSLRNNFMMDDDGLILQDTKIHHLQYLRYQFIPDKQQYLNIEDARPEVYYRPLAHLVPMICYIFFREDVVGYHWVNCILFLGCVIVFYHLVQRLLNNPECATLVAVFYAVHPINGLFINYITASVFAIQMMAMAGSLLLFLRALELSRGALALLASCVLYLIGLLCHETTLALPLYMFATLWLLEKKYYQRTMVLLSPYIVISLGYVLFRVNHASLKSSVWDKLLISFSQPLSLWASNIKLFFWYISKFFYPDGIVIKWTTAPVTTYFWVWFFMFTLIIVLWFYYLHKSDRVKLWGLSILLLGFLPVLVGSSFELHHGFILEPHWLFFPSLGMFVILAHYMLQLKKVINRTWYTFSIFIIVIVLISWSRYLNGLWGNEVQYCRYWLKHSAPHKGITFYLASALMKEGRLQEAKEAYHRALEGAPLDWQIHVNLGLIAQQEKNIPLALQELGRALELYPRSSVIANNLGVVHRELNNPDQARHYFRQAIRYNPYSLESRLNLAFIYIQEKNWPEALKLYQENLLIDPHHEETLLGRWKVLSLTGAQETLITQMDHILRASYSATLYLRLAELMAENQHYELAIRSFHRALARDPGRVEIYIQMGKFAGNLGQFDQAIRIWEQALRLDKDNQEVRDLMGRAQALANEFH